MSGSKLQWLAGLVLLALAPSAGPAAADPADSVTMTSANAPTRILDAQGARRLRTNRGLTLQWIDWNRRGTARVVIAGGRWHLSGSQTQRGGPGRVVLEGTVTEIGRDYFLFDGTVRIADTPDRGRQCEKHDVWRFAITQNRHYWRIRTFEWCDELTDYIDIYF